MFVNVTTPGKVRTKPASERYSKALGLYRQLSSTRVETAPSVVVPALSLIDSRSTPADPNLHGGWPARRPRLMRTMPRAAWLFPHPAAGQHQQPITHLHPAGSDGC